MWAAAMYRRVRGGAQLVFGPDGRVMVATLEGPYKARLRELVLSDIGKKLRVAPEDAAGISRMVGEKTIGGTIR